MKEASKASAETISAMPRKNSIACREITGRVFESEKDDKGRITFPVVIISQGMGNLGDRNYYTKQAIEQAASEGVYEGKKAYFDHPTPTSEREQPNRSVREIAGHYENTRADVDESGLAVLRGDFVPVQSSTEVIGLLNHATSYKAKYPDSDFVGVSINGDGEGEELSYQEFLEKYKPSAVEMAKIKQIEGQSINAITKLTSAQSADLVTEPGAKGRVLLEQERKLKRRKVMFAAMSKLFRGVEQSKRDLVEEAVKDMLQDETKQSKEDEDEAKHAEGLAKALLNYKKESKKYEDESEAEYEARCMKQALQAMKPKKEDEDEGKEDEAKHKQDEDEGKKESKQDADGDSDGDDGKPDGKDGKPVPPAKDKKEAKGEDEDGEKDAGGDDHPDKDKDIALIKKMMKQMGERMEKMEAALGHKEDEVKQAKKEAAEAKIKLSTEDRARLVEQVMEQTKLPNRIRKLVRPVVEACKTKEEMLETAKKLAGVYSASVEEIMVRESSVGFVEKSEIKSDESTDKLFI